MTDQTEILTRLFVQLQNDQAAQRLDALEQLGRLNHGSREILGQLEKLAVEDRSKAVREAALVLLTAPIYRDLQRKIATLDRSSREALLAEIATWRRSRLLREEQIAVLRQRYDFDLVPPPQAPPPQPVPAPAAAPKPAPAAPAPAAVKVQTPAAPRLSLMQVLLSETSIKIMLYLGAFLVIAGALILAALIAVARLPILTAATILFGLAAVTIRKRLPQPGFILATVFSVLLPIDGSVLADQLGLHGDPLTIYWIVLLLALAVLWGFSVWLYRSRFFSITTFLAFDIAMGLTASLFDPPIELYLLFFSLAAVAGVLAVGELSAWKDRHFALPLFILLQVQAGMLLFTAILITLAGSVLTRSWPLVLTGTWLILAAFSILSHARYPFVLFPWIAALCLLPLPSLTLQGLQADTLTRIAGLAFWATLMAAGGELLATREKGTFHAYGLPMLVGSFPLFLQADAWALMENELMAFLCLGTTALVYSLASVRKLRLWLWAPALLAAAGAYMMFFQIPAIGALDIFGGYQLLGLTLLLLGPDLFLKKDLAAAPGWRFPPRIMAVTIVAGLTVALPVVDDGNRAAIIFSTYALFFLAYALLYGKPVIGYLFTTFTALAGLALATYFGPELWLPVLTGLAVAYYLASLVVKAAAHNDGWNSTVRNSALVLGLLLALPALVSPVPYAGWYVLALAILFGFDSLKNKAGLLEGAVAALAAEAYWLLLHEAGIRPVAYYLTGMGVIVLAIDMVYFRFLGSSRPLRWPVRIAGGVLTLSATMLLAALPSDTTPGTAAILYGGLAIFFLVYALLYRLPTLGFLATPYPALAIVFLLRQLEQAQWMLPLTALAVVYYAAGFLLKRRGLNWGTMLSSSGLALGLLVSLSAPSENSFGATLPIVIALLFGIEMVWSRNSLFEPIAEALAVEAFCMLLGQLQVQQEGYYLYGSALVVLGLDLLLTLVYKRERSMRVPVRVIGGLIAMLATFNLLFSAAPLGTIPHGTVAALLAGFAAFFLIAAIVHRQPKVGYAFTGYGALALLMLLQAMEQSHWLFPLVGLAVLYYAIGIFLNSWKGLSKWAEVLVISGLGLGTLTAISAPFEGGLIASLPVAGVATLFAVEAFRRRNVWLGFPSNAFYLMAYFMSLVELRVDQPQFFTVGAALLGLVMHYFLVRSGSKVGGLLTGMLSQLVLLSATYIQMITTGQQVYFVVLFLQALAVLIYGMVIRSRSLVFTPIFFVTLSVITVVIHSLRGLSTAVLIGVTGVLMIAVGTIAVLMREKLLEARSAIGERLSQWNP